MSKNQDAPHLPSPMNEGILLVNKPRGKTSFSLVSLLRKRTQIKKIGHAGTLDPFATGVMVMLIGKSFTRLSDQFLTQDKEYEAKVHLGIGTDTYDCEGTIVSQNPTIPTICSIESALNAFQGTILQTPPMFSAKKIGGQKLYDLARKGIVIERKPVLVQLNTTLISYTYPYLQLRIHCSKGTYIRSIAHDLGEILGIGAHLCELTRTRSGPYHLKDCLEEAQLLDPTLRLNEWLKTYDHCDKAT